MYAYRRTYEETIHRFLTVFTRLKKYIFLLSEAPCSAGTLGPGLAGLCLKTALPMPTNPSVVESKDMGNFLAVKPQYILRKPVGNEWRWRQSMWGMGMLRVGDENKIVSPRHSLHTRQGS